MKSCHRLHTAFVTTELAVRLHLGAVERRVAQGSGHGISCLTEHHGLSAVWKNHPEHGTQDQVVVLKRDKDSRDALKALGHPVQWHTYPMPDSMHTQEIVDIAAFLKPAVWRL